MSDDAWVKFQSARNIGEATLIKNVLENAGLEVVFRGEHRPSIAGELPFPEAEIELWVREADAARAEAALARSLATSDAPPQRCPHCGEENPGNFGSCWNCEAALDNADPSPS